MYFIIFVEGSTEDKILPDFLTKWLNTKLPEKVSVRTVNFKGYANLYKDVAQKAIMHLNSPQSDEIIAIIGLLDLHGPNFYPEELHTVDEKYLWAKQHLEEQVGSPRFRQHFAVHELEAWLLSDSSLFPVEISLALDEASANPEKVNFNRPPSKLLHDLYLGNLNRTYKKVTEGNKLFTSLDPEKVREKCPYFKVFTDDLLELALRSQR
ncbi:MAG: DUF4276 family protein [Bacillota bacterium]|nr:DUF4276 family protein [Bacillota bacterium]